MEFRNISVVPRSFYALFDRSERKLSVVIVQLLEPVLVNFRSVY